MKTKRTVPLLLAITSLLGLLASACYVEPAYYSHHHHRYYRDGYYRSSVELKVDAAPAAQAGVTAK
jgi:hypothetical protein